MSLVDIQKNTKIKAGEDGVKVWNLKTRKQITIPQQPVNKLSEVSCVCWVTRRNETVDTLCYGNGAGFLVFLQHHATEVSTGSYPCPGSLQRTDSMTQGCFEAVHSARLARGEEITCITADISGEKTVRIATGTRDRCVHVWLFDSSTRELKKVYSMEYSSDKGIVPKALAFDSNEERDFYVFGLYDGGL